MNRLLQRLTLTLFALSTVLLPAAAQPLPALAGAPTAAISSGGLTGTVSFSGASPYVMTVNLTDPAGSFGNGVLFLGPGTPTVGLVSGFLQTNNGNSTFLTGRWVGGPTGGQLRVLAILPSGSRMLVEAKWYASGIVVGGWRI